MIANVRYRLFKKSKKNNEYAFTTTNIEQIVTIYISFTVLLYYKSNMNYNVEHKYVTLMLLLFLSQTGYDTKKKKKLTH